MSPPDFDSLCNELNRPGNGGEEMHPAELHGLACGILAAGFQPSPDQWLQEVANYTDQPPLEAGDNSPLLELYADSLQQLAAGDFEFQLCLPDDDLYGLPERSESLARWCQGFLHGFAATQQPLSDENRELLQDLVEISRLDPPPDRDEAGEDENESEGYYAELAEFVRMAVISLFMDHSNGGKPSGGEALHHGYH